MIEYELKFESISHFLREYDNHLRHGGVFLPISPAPPMYTKVRILLVLPPDQTRLTVEASVVASLPQGVGVQLEEMKGTTRFEFERQLEICRSLHEKRAADAPTHTEHHRVRGREQSTAPAPLAAHPQRAVESSGPLMGAAREVGGRLPKRRGTFASGDDVRTTVSQLRERVASLSNNARDPLKSTDAHAQASAPFPTLPPVGDDLKRSFRASPHANNQRDIAPSLEVGNLDELLPPENPPMKEASGLSGSKRTDDLFSPPKNEPLQPQEESSLLSPDLHLLDAFPPEDISLKSSLSPTHVPSQTNLPVTHKPPTPSFDQWDAGAAATPEQLSVSSADWSSALSLSYDVLPAFNAPEAGRFTPPPETLSSPLMGALTPVPTSAEECGEISPGKLTKLLPRLFREARSGLCQVKSTRRGKEIEYKVFFYKGKIVCILELPLVDSNLLGQILLSLGHIDRPSLEEALAKSDESDARLGDVLVECGHCELREVARGLRRQLQQRVRALSTLEEGTYSFFPQIMPGKKTPLAPPTGPVRLLFRALLERHGEKLYEEAKAMELPYSDMYVVRTDEADELLGACELTANERRFWNELLTGQFSLREIHTASTFNRKRTHATIFALRDLGLLRFQKELAEDWKIEEMRAFLGERKRLIGQGTFFDFLGIHWSASKGEIEAACKRVETEYDISKKEGNWPDDLIDLSKEILAYVEKARAALLDPKTRHGHRRSQYHDSQIGFSVDLLMEQADMCLYRRDYETALERLAQALELEPHRKDVKEKIIEAKRLQYEKPAAPRMQGFELKVDWERLSKESHEKKSEGPPEKE